MFTYTLILSLITGQGAAITTIDFTDVKREEAQTKCDIAGSQWKESTTSFGVVTRYTCVKK